MLRCVVMWCNALWCVVTHCHVYWCSVLRFNMTQWCILMCYCVLRFVAMCCDVLQCIVVYSFCKVTVCWDVLFVCCYVQLYAATCGFWWDTLCIHNFTVYLWFKLWLRKLNSEEQDYNWLKSGKILKKLASVILDCNASFICRKNMQFCKEIHLSSNIHQRLKNQDIL